MQNTGKFWQNCLLILMGGLVVLAGWCSYQLAQGANERATIMKDHGEANSIIYGIFSADEWKDKVESIVSKRIENFELSRKQDSLLRVQVSSLLHNLISEVKHKINKEDQSLKHKIRKISAKVFVDWEALRSEVPVYTNEIVQHLKKKQSKERLKSLLQSKLEDLAAQTYDETDSVMLHKLYQQYHTNSLSAFNDKVQQEAAELQTRNYWYVYGVLGIILAFLAVWWAGLRYYRLHKPLFVLSVLLGIVVLIAGLATPMIEIDARIQEFNFVLLGEPIQFNNQILFYRSKSILEMVQLLLQSTRFDSIFVGMLVLAFSVLMPVSKLIANGTYLFAGTSLRNNQFVQWLAFKSGKWSMADVMVVAIFMAFIGFDSILDNQLKMMAFNNQRLSSITTNNTALQSGFVLFMAYVLYSLLLSSFLNKLIKKHGY